MTRTATLERTGALASRSLKDLKGYRVEASDGEIGKVDDFYFDDATWTLRYFVIKTGSWLSGRRTLVSPEAFTHSNGGRRTITTSLERKTIEDAPSAELDKPVSRQFELELRSHFAWPLYWKSSPVRLVSKQGDPHLRSVNEVLGYTIGATDGEIGHVEDLIVDKSSWSIRYLVVDTRNWLPGRKVIVSPLWIADVSWPMSRVTVDLTRESIENAPQYDPTQPINRDYENRLCDYYGRPRYWV